MNYSTFSELTVAQYQQLYQINRSDDDETDKAIASVSVLTGLTRWEVEDLQLTDFKKVTREIGIIFQTNTVKAKLPRKLKINGVHYKVIYDCRKLRSGQYIDLQTFISRNIIENMHRIMASLLITCPWWGKGVYDAENHEAISEGVREMNFLQVNAVCVFFLKFWNDSIKASEPYLLREMSKAGMTLDPTTLQNLMGGFITQRGFQPSKI